MKMLSARPQVLFFLLICSIILYILSLFLPAIVYKNGTYHDYSADCSYYDTAASSTDCLAQVKANQDAQIIANNRLPKHVDRGLTVLGFGFFGFFMGILAWFANIFFYTTLILVALRKYFLGAIMAIAGFVLGLQSFFFNSYPADESGGNTIYVDHLSWGFYVWLASLLLLALYCYLRHLQTHKEMPVKTSESYEVLGNTSGQGKDAPVPTEIHVWNWGAFGLNWIWGIGNKTYFALLALIPLVGVVIAFILGANGNKLAWQNKHWDSVEQFKKAQRLWVWAWFAYLVITVAISFCISRYVWH